MLLIFPSNRDQSLYVRGWTVMTMLGLDVCSVIPMRKRHNVCHRFPNVAVISSAIASRVLSYTGTVGSLK